MKLIKQMALGCLLLLSACGKYLDAVPDSGLTVPQTVADFEQLLQNETMYINSPAIGEFGSDDLFMPDALLASQPIDLRNGYIWAKDIYEGSTTGHWNTAYSKIYTANAVLEGIEKLEGKAAPKDINMLRGWSLFCRAYAMYDLAQVFAQPYRPASAAIDVGLPLRLSTNLKELSARASIAETYQQILADLELAVELLPEGFFKTNRNQPTKCAGYALLARVKLTMQDYNAALEYTDKSLALYSVLLDYNAFTPGTGLSFSPIIDEVIYSSIQINYVNRNWQIDKTLYDSYSSNDLRKTLFFTVNATTSAITFKGFYSTIYAGFNGLTTDELYLIKAECQARLNREGEALETLNQLLIKRYKKGLFQPYSLSSTPQVLDLILAERRKECVFRNLRWPDLRRLNQDPRLAKTLSRSSNGVNYQLLPNDPKYTLPIPDEEIRNSGIAQNRR